MVRQDRHLRARHLYENSNFALGFEVGGAGRSLRLSFELNLVQAMTGTEVRAVGEFELLKDHDPADHNLVLFHAPKEFFTGLIEVPVGTCGVGNDQLRKWFGTDSPNPSGHHGVLALCRRFFVAHVGGAGSRLT